MTKPNGEVVINAPVATDKPMCGLVMPISALDGCAEQHWIEVKEIFTEAIDSIGFAANLVSYADDVGIIQKRIIQNLYDNPIVVCDVSGKNPNVMFELGMRLAFDKPTIIVKDDKTTYSFDTSPIEHLEYPRDLRFSRIVAFKKQLADKIKGTYQKSKDDPNFTPFLKHFGKFTVAKLESTEVSKEDYIIQQLADMRDFMLRDREMLRQEIMVSHEIAEAQRREEMRRRKQGTLPTGLLVDADKDSMSELVTQEILRAAEEMKQRAGSTFELSKLEDEVVARVEKRLPSSSLGVSIDELRRLIRQNVRKILG